LFRHESIVLKPESYDDSFEDIILSEDAIQPTFYEWLAKNTNYIKNMDVLLATYNLFRQKNLGFDCPDEIKNENKERLIEMLGHDGFVFV
jgi:hypothetical protein